jgi:hypothetical protein
LNKKITIIIVALLMVSSCAVFGVPRAKADMSDVKILSYNTYLSPANSATNYAGDLIVVGELQNTGTAEVFDLPQISAIAYTTDGLSVAAAYATAYVKDLLPQQKAAFYIDFSPASSDPNGNYSGTLGWLPMFNHVTLNVWAQATNDTMYRGLAVAGSTSYSVNGVYSVTGYVQNTGGQLTGNVWVVTTFYNASGSVIAANYTNFLTHSLAPNASISFLATPMDNTAALSSQIANYSVLVQTMPYEAPVTSAPTASPSSSSSPTPTATTPPVDTTGSQGSSLSPDLIYIIGGVVVIVVVIALMFVIRKRKS